MMAAFLEQCLLYLRDVADRIKMAHLNRQLQSIAAQRENDDQAEEQIRARLTVIKRGAQAAAQDRVNRGTRSHIRKIRL